MPLARIAGTAIPFGRDDVDTDLIIPSQYMKTVSRTGLGSGAFAALRAEPGNIFDDPRYAGASILIAGRNFGCGSSREHAVWALQDMGFKAVIARSFGEIFESNAFRNGLVAISIDRSGIESLLEAAATGPVEIDLEQEAIFAAGGVRLPFSLDPFRKDFLVNGWDEIELTSRLESQIAQFEERQAREQPWLLSGLAGAASRHAIDPGTKES